MALSDRIKGLSQHKIELPPPSPEPVAQFDQDKADHLLQDTCSLISSAYTAGALDWLQENRTDVCNFLKECETVVEAAYLSKDMSKLVQALAKYQGAYQRAFKLFEARPPVIEVQEVFPI